MKLLSNFRTSTGRSLRYLKAEYPAPKSSSAIDTPKFFILESLSDAVDRLFSSAVSVTSIPKSPGLMSSLCIKSLNIARKSLCKIVCAETLKNNVTSSNPYSFLASKYSFTISIEDITTSEKTFSPSINGMTLSFGITLFFSS